MKIEVVLSPALYDGRQLRAHHISVAVDILRATSAVCAAFSSGVSEIVPLDSLDDLPRYRDLGYTLAAERGGEKMPGAVCGNSPTEYLGMSLAGQRLAYSTTNGTVSILRASTSDLLLVGAFANISSLSAALIARADEDLVILCSGWQGDPSIEDTVFAGALIHKLQASGVDVSFVNDAAMMASDLWLEAASDPYRYCSKATHVERLMRLGCERDIRWAFLADTCPLVPCYRDGRLVLIN
ncbi:MAG: 2-phosphosulfolactate phosphatase [Bacteroidales bacterium]|nr:2-phosphosulfolactate phosphatase [Bacteroidales bacterium]